MKKKLLAILLALALVLGLSATAIAATGETTLSVFFRDIIVTRDGEEVVLKDEQGNILEPFLYNSSTYLPIRAIAEATGAKVEWDGDTHTVILDYPEQEPEYIYIPVVAPAEPEKVVDLPDAVDKSTLPRVIVTTDLEVDDMNGILLTLMYSTEFDLAGLVWTAGQFHFTGDGEHTLEEISAIYNDFEDTQDVPYGYKCNGGTYGGTVEHLGQVTEYRPVNPDLLTRYVDQYYREDYEYLIQNNPNYPSPDYLLSITKTGNVEFEGDYRYETEGSQLIYDAIMDDDMRPLYIQHWGGINTTVRALQSIYEDYYGTEQWDEVLAKVVAKVRICGTGEDNCWSYSNMEQKFPGIVIGYDGYNGGTGFTNFFGAASKAEFFGGTAEELLPYYQSEFLTDAFKLNHGAVLGAFHTMDDGQVLYGEPYVYQYGLTNVFDWGVLYTEGWSSDPILTTIFPRLELDRYDWLGCQWGTSTFVKLGTRSDIKNSYDNRYTALLFADLAARADWAICAPEDCNHAPIVSADVLDFTAKAGETVTMNGTVSDPDGDELNITWSVPVKTCTYAGEGELVVTGGGETGSFTVPADAVAGDRFVVNMEVQDTGVERPMTIFAQFVITVE